MTDQKAKLTPWEIISYDYCLESDLQSKTNFGIIPIKYLASQAKYFAYVSRHYEYYQLKIKHFPNL